jgi:hypothetical protein
VRIATGIQKHLDIWSAAQLGRGGSAWLGGGVPSERQDLGRGAPTASAGPSSRRWWKVQQKKPHRLTDKSVYFTPSLGGVYFTARCFWRIYLGGVSELPLPKKSENFVKIKKPHRLFGLTDTAASVARIQQHLTSSIIRCDHTEPSNLSICFVV